MYNEPTNLQIGVKLLLQNSHGDYLLLNRASHYSLQDDVQDAWDIPGGRIDASEPLAMALKREVQEELGINLTGDTTLLAAQDIILPNKNLHVVRLTYIATQDVLDSNITLSTEHTGFRWFSRADLKNLDVEPYLKEVILSL